MDISKRDQYFLHCYLITTVALAWLLKAMHHQDMETVVGIMTLMLRQAIKKGIHSVVNVCVIVCVCVHIYTDKNSWNDP